MLKIYLLVKTVERRLRNIARACFREVWNVQIDVNKVLDSAIKKAVIKNLIQVGSNDGKKNDPIRPFIEKYPHLNGVLVEPMKNNFDKLVKNYSEISHHLFFLNAGISNKKENLTFYFIKNISPDEPGWYDQVSSFDKETFIKNIEVKPELLKRIGEETIECFTIDEVIHLHKLNPVDLIHLDAEGFDYRIIKSINMQHSKPVAILFETDWMSQYELREIKKFLASHSYKLFFDGIDCLAFQKEKL